MRKFILINSRLEIAHLNQCSACAVQCQTIKKTTNSYVNQHDILPSITINSSRARQLLCPVNVTGLRHQVKIKNLYIYFFKIIKQNMETSLRTGFAEIFSCCPKNLSCPKFGGTAALLAPSPPPGPYAYSYDNFFFQSPLRL